MYEATTLSKLIEFLGIIFIAVVSAINLTLGRTRKVIRPPWWKGSGGGGGDGSLPCVFYMLQYFETSLPSVESLWSSLQDEVYFMGDGAAGGLWRADIWLIRTAACEMHYFSKCNVKLWSVSILSLKQCTVKQLLLLGFVISGIIKVSVSVLLAPALGSTDKTCLDI